MIEIEPGKGAAPAPCRLLKEPVVIVGGWRIGEGFCRWSRQIFAAILDVWQENFYEEQRQKARQDAVQRL